MAAGATAQVTDLERRKADRVFAKWDRRDSPGCALAVMREGRVIYTRG